MATKVQLEKALELACVRFLKRGRMDCGTLKCNQKNTTSCIGKVRTCIKAHREYFIKQAKDTPAKEE